MLGFEELELGLGGIGIDDELELWLDWQAATAALNVTNKTGRISLFFSICIIILPNPRLP